MPDRASYDITATFTDASAVATVIVAVGSLAAQSPAVDPILRFEVASIKPNKSGDVEKGMGPEPGGRFGAINVPLRDLIPIAYGIPPQLAEFRIVGGPSWMDTDRFDVAAKAEGTPSQQEIGLMVRTMLADRFKLTVRRETRELPVYALVMTKNDRSLGPQLRSSDPACAAIRAENAANFGKAPLPPPPPGTPVPCSGSRFGAGRVISVARSMEEFATTLAPFANRVVLDRTGLSGLFDLTLQWTRDLTDPNGLSVFTAMQEQLGLTLQSTRGPIDVVVIDSVERPTPN